MNFLAHSRALYGLKCALLAATATWALACMGEEYFNLPAGFSVSDPKWYGQEIGDECWLLRYQDRSFGYVTSLTRAGDAILLEKCHDKADDMPESVQNGFARGWFLARPGSSVLIPFAIEGLDRFSAQIACATRVAYWGKGRNEYFAYVADVRTQSILKKKALGKARIATDWRNYHPFPRWKEDCSEVVFADDRHFNPVHLTFAAEPYLTRYFLTENAHFPNGVSVSKHQLVYKKDGDPKSCALLRMGNNSLGWISLSIRADNGLLVEKCERVCPYGEECNYRKSGEECRHGRVFGWFAVTPERPILRRLQGMDSFSNPMPCGSRVAYWGSEVLPKRDTGLQYFAYVAELHSGAILEMALVGQARIESHHPIHFAYPRWKSDCSEVVFDESRYFEPVTFPFGAKGDAGTDPVQPQE